MGAACSKQAIIHFALCLQDNDPGSPTRIKSVSSCSLGGRAIIHHHVTQSSHSINAIGRAIIVPDAASGKCMIRYISKTPATAGTDTFNYTTDLGGASVSVLLTPGACSETSCGVQKPNTAAAGKKAATQPGTCQAGRCICVPDEV
jgi:hypothetical protein